MANIEITQELVREYFDYHKDGYLIWKKKDNRFQTSIKVGEKAGGLHKNRGRYKITFKEFQYFSARLIFLWHKGYFPIETDHIDRNSKNDRIENLREANRSQNCCNRRSFKNSTSEYLGVCFKIIKSKNHSRTTGELKITLTERWVAQIQVNGKRKEIGRFKTELEAVLAYNREAVRYFKEFANLNIFKPKTN
jgi:hypothetical protein